MKVSKLSRKQKSELEYKLYDKIIDVIPTTILVLVIAGIGTYFRWNQWLIGTVISVTVGNNIITININTSISKDSKKD